MDIPQTSCPCIFAHLKWSFCSDFGGDDPGYTVTFDTFSLSATANTAALCIDLIIPGDSGFPGEAVFPSDRTLGEPLFGDDGPYLGAMTMEDDRGFPGDKFAGVPSLPGYLAFANDLLPGDAISLGERALGDIFFAGECSKAGSE